jgi:hypothetical protein
MKLRNIVNAVISAAPYFFSANNKYTLISFVQRKMSKTVSREAILRVLRLLSGTQ